MTRQKVTRNIQYIDLDGPVDTVLEDIREAKAKALQQGWTNLYISVDHWGDTLDTQLRGDRDETDQEMRGRLEWERRCQEEQAEKERKEYERLARKFGGI